MKMLKKAENQTAFGKVGIYGDAGSGKTFTAACLAIGLHKFAKCTKPIAFFDTEPSLSYVLPLFKEAGIEVYSYESRSLSDLMGFMKEAEEECSIIIIDSITHVWRDAQKSFLDKKNIERKGRKQNPLDKLEFHHWGAIKDVWGKFTDKFLCSKAHVILCGRLSSIYEYQTNEKGKKELITNGTKMATEKELGYEPSLLIEMIKHREHGRIINRALIEKDRFNYLNGEEIDFTPHKGVDINNILDVFERVKPHFQHLNLTGTHFDSMNERDSKDLYPDTDADEWPSEQRQRLYASEELEGLVNKHYPSMTVIDKKARADIYEQFLGSRSWSKISEGYPSQKIKEALHQVRIFLEGMEDEKVIIDQLQADKLNGLLKDDPERLTRIIQWAGVGAVEKMTLTFYNRAMDKLREEQGQETIDDSKKKVA